MRKTLLGVVCGVGLVLAAVGWEASTDKVYAQRTNIHSGDGQWITHTLPLDDQHQQLLVLDQRMGTVAVYHVSRATGELSLKSVRNIQFDLQMVEFNSQQPSPQDIRALLEQK